MSAGLSDGMSAKASTIVSATPFIRLIIRLPVTVTFATIVILLIPSIVRADEPRTPGARPASAPASAAGEDDEALRDLVTSTLLDFNVAVKARDFSAFHYRLAAPFQRQKSREELLTIFAPFIEKHADIGGVRDVPPVFDKPPAVGEDGLLALSGHYETRPFRVVFDLKYKNEPRPDPPPADNVAARPAPSRWRLVGISLNMAPVPDEPRPTTGPTSVPAGGR